MRCNPFSRCSHGCSWRACFRSGFFRRRRRRRQVLCLSVALRGWGSLDAALAACCAATTCLISSEQPSPTCGSFERQANRQLFLRAFRQHRRGCKISQLSLGAYPPRWNLGMSVVAMARDPPNRPRRLHIGRHFLGGFRCRDRTSSIAGVGNIVSSLVYDV